ncbi:hypothetical protein MINTM005_12820 [Mycobacterium intracellulare]|uniref:hypothetical protein n=1 Tax=Mycobacterium intracellulare TaxID=1767 RepID=UPI001927FBF8|nr:hypothetical protein [Mycobacterium intracellulare]BCO56038.1 hypothetical protein MINTM005_12820 [Mycobacterium intracellulare]
MSTITWEQRGKNYYYAEGDWEYLIHRHGSMWRLCERRIGDLDWDTISYLPTLEEAMAAQ